MTDPVRKQDLVRIWIVLMLAYVTLKFAFNLVAFGWVDLRPATLAEIAVIPLGQAIVLAALKRR